MAGPHLAAKAAMAVRIDSGMLNWKTETTDIPEYTDSQGFMSMGRLTLRMRRAASPSRSLSVLSVLSA